MRTGRPKITQEEFIRRCEEKHGNKFDYSNVIYEHSKSKISLKCKKCGNEFTQVTCFHGYGSGCKKCAQLQESLNKFEKAKSSFIGKCIKKYGSKFDLSEVEYKGVQEKIIVTCTVHSLKFDVLPNNFLKKNGCCKKCLKESNAISKRFIDAKISFIDRAKAIHGGKYDYSKTHYEKSFSKVIITCKKHGDFKQAPSDHLKGTGCTSCSSRGFDKNKSAILYYLKIYAEEGIYYKIGITNLTVKERFKKHKNRMEILMVETYSKGEDAVKEESRILKKYKAEKYTGPNVIRDGNTELFLRDILNMDK